MKPPTMLNKWTRRAAVLLAFGTSGFVSYAVAGSLHRGRAPVDIESSGAAERVDSTAVPENPFASANGRHLIAYVIAASDCGWATQPAVMKAVAGIRSHLTAKYGQAFAQVSVIGVALDEDIGQGMAFLDNVSSGNISTTFDQVSVGGSWLNEAVLRFVWRDAIAPAASPQVVVVARWVNTEDYLAGKITVAADSILVSPVGSAQIIDWITNETPLSDASGT